MASKRTSDSTKNHHVPSTKRIRHDDDDDNREQQQHPLYRTIRRSRSATDHNIAFSNIIREEIPHILDRCLAPSGGLTVNRWINPSGRKCLKLYFVNNLHKRNYTQSIIKAEGGEPLRIELRDTENQHIVRDVGSLMEIEICVLHGDFRKEDSTAEEFDKQIVIPRKGKEPLLKGDTVIKLKDGIAYINNMEFTDISKRRTDEFRLGAKIVRSNSIGLDIREGRSEPFRVLNVRGKAYQKHDRPSMNDELWRLRGIRKDGKFQEKLAAHGIISVKDFLQLYKTDEVSLRKKIGKIPEKSWNTIIAHVKECDVDDDDLQPLPIHSLVETSTGIQTAQYGGRDQTLQQFDDVPIDQQGLLNTDPTSFNPSIACQPEMWPSTSISHSDQIALGEMPTFLYGEGNMFSGLDQVSQTGQFGRSFSMEQFNANLLCFDYGADGVGPSNLAEQHAYKNLNDQTAQHGGQDQTLQKFHFPIPQQGQKEIGPGYVQPCASTSYANEGMNNCQINVDNSVPNITEIPQNNDVEGEMCIEEIRNIINNVSFDFSDVVECSTRVNFVNSGTDISNNGKPKAVWWCKIRAVIKWGISVRKVVAAKRNY